MSSSTQDQIRAAAKSERAAIVQLDSTLDQQRTPYLKSRLRLALHRLDDVDTILRFELKASPQHARAWLNFAAENVSMASNERQQVQKLVDVYGGPAKIVEIGGYG